MVEVKRDGNDYVVTMNSKKAAGMTIADLCQMISESEAAKKQISA